MQVSPYIESILVIVSTEIFLLLLLMLVLIPLRKRKRRSVRKKADSSHNIELIYGTDYTDTESKGSSLNK